MANQVPVLGSTIDDLQDNIRTLERYLREGTPDEKEGARKLIKNGICFVEYKINNKSHFAPSRFIGYFENKLEMPVPHEKHGSKTNNKISSLLNAELSENKAQLDSYATYCNSLGIEFLSEGTGRSKKKFWPYNGKLDL